MIKSTSILLLPRLLSNLGQLPHGKWKPAQQNEITLNLLNQRLYKEWELQYNHTDKVCLLIKAVKGVKSFRSHDVLCSVRTKIMALVCHLAVDFLI